MKKGKGRSEEGHLDAARVRPESGGSMGSRDGWEYLNLAGVMFVVIGRDAKVEFINKRGSEILGLSKDIITGRDWFEFVPERIRGDVKTVFGRIMAGELDPVEYYENPVVTASGAERLIAWHNSLVKDDKGAITASLSLGEDVTKKREIEESLRKAVSTAEEERAKTSAVLAALGDGVSIQDTNFKVLYQNQAHKGFIGDRAGEYCYVAYAGRLSVCEGCPVAACFKDGAVHKLEKSQALESGTRYFEIAASPLRNARGEIIAGIELVRDTTERKRSEAALADAEATFRSLVEHSLVGIYIVREGRMFYVNPTLAEIVGYSQDELTSKPVLDVVYEGDHALVKENIRKRLDGEVSSIRYAFRLKRKDGGLVDVEAYGTVTHIGGKPAIIGTLLDLSDRKKLETELLKAEKLESLGVLAGGIAHEFNNFLTAIIGNVSLAKMYSKPGYEAHTMLTEAEMAATKARDLASRLLTFSKGDAPVKKPVHLKKLITDAVSFALSGSTANCEFSLDDDLMPAEADEGQIARALNNIVINAQQAMQGGGTVRVAASNVSLGDEMALPLEKGEYIRISVEDSGPGIPKENLDRIFDPFYTTKGSSGLGLSSAYSIVRKHGGFITVDSAPGRTVFDIYLPATGLMAAPVALPAEAPALGRGRVLVMDDEELVRMVAGRMLGQCGYDAESAPDGEAAVELYKKAMASGKPFDAVIIDLVIKGGMGGLETIKKLLELDPNIKAVLSSGYSDDPVLADYKARGFKGVLPKPYETSELGRVLSQVIKRET